MMVYPKIKVKVKVEVVAEIEVKDVTRFCGHYKR
jgi:hypothetical protein